MGRPYAEEMDRLPEAYRRARRAPIETLSGFVRGAAGRPLYAVGSGGSFSAATLASALHQRAGAMSRCLTPLEFEGLGGIGGDSHVMIITAGGNNRDVLAAFEAAVRYEPAGICIVCSRTGSRLARRASGEGGVVIHEDDAPAGGDGFLATNSLVSAMVWLARAYVGLPLPYEIPAFARLAGGADTAALHGRDSLVILYDAWGKAAAVDAESKLSEAGLVCSQVSDYRNFAHGRHNWLDKNRNTGIVALVTPDCSALAKRTLGLVPGYAPAVALRTAFDGPAASIDLTIQVMLMVGSLGAAAGIDPGRPGVPDFGRRMYGIGIRPAGPGGLGDLEQLALRRKFGSPGSGGAEARGRVSALRRFVDRMGAQRFGAAVFDYDGTLCDPERRSSGPSARTGSLLARLVRRGVAVGVATGRGRSVRGQLRRLLPDRYHGKVLIGYYNCSEIGSLADDRIPDPGRITDARLGEACEALRSRGELRGIRVTGRPLQVTLESPGMDAARVRRHVGGGVKVVESDHSVDLLAPGVSKLALFEAVRARLPPGLSVLCVGDKGRPPGDDHELLGTAHSLSVGEASGDASSCWNLLPTGTAGEAGVLEYFNGSAISGGAFTVGNLLGRRAGGARRAR